MQMEKEKVALTSIAASALLTLSKGVVGVMTGSLAILSEAAHSLLDLVATVMTYFAVRVSGKPADAEHHYGHGKFESVTALAETALLFLLSGVVFWEAGTRLIVGVHHDIEVTWIAFAVIAVSVIVDFFRARTLGRVAKETDSEALEADALHFSSDLWSSLAVLAGLGGVAAGLPWADSAAAVAVAVFVCIVGWRLGRRTIDTLTDTAPPGAATQISDKVSRIPGIVAIERIRARSAAGVVFIDLHAAVSRTLPLDRVEALKARAEAAIRADFPRSEIAVTIEPRALDDESARERVMIIARNRALAIHHVTVHTVDGRLAIALDLEVDGTLSLREAHDIATGLEAAITEELGQDIEIDTHIEPQQADDATGTDAPPERTARIAGALADIANAFGTLQRIHDVRVRTTPDGEVVNFHCYVAPELTVLTVHDRVDEVERRLRERFPAVKRIIGHAEPFPDASL